MESLLHALKSFFKATAHVTYALFKKCLETDISALWVSSNDITCPATQNIAQCVKSPGTLFHTVRKDISPPSPCVIWVYSSDVLKLALFVCHTSPFLYCGILQKFRQPY